MIKSLGSSVCGVLGANPGGQLACQYACQRRNAGEVHECSLKRCDGGRGRIVASDNRNDDGNTDGARKLSGSLGDCACDTEMRRVNLGNTCASENGWSCSDAGTNQ